MSNIVKLSDGSTVYSTNAHMRLILHPPERIQAEAEPPKPSWLKDQKAQGRGDVLELILIGLLVLAFSVVTYILRLWLWAE